MTDRAEQLLVELLALPLDEREIVALHLNSSIDEDDEDPAFVEELNRRIEDIKSGRETPKSAAEDLQDIREKLREARHASLGSAAGS